VVVALVAGVPEASTVAESSRDRWRSDVEAAGLDPNEVIYPFAASPAMKAWAAEVVGSVGGRDAEDILEVLQLALFDDEFFDFTYARNVTLTASEAFSQRRGNCMSFTVLFVALARSVGIEASLVSVQRSPEFQRDDDLVVVNHHVVAGYRAASSWTLYDFYLTDTVPYISKRAISDIRASAMFHANLGAMALFSGDSSEAMRHLTLCVGLAPDWAPAWVNLGVAHLRLGERDRAFAAYSHALSLDPNNSSALTNMAVIYRDQGRLAEAQAALAAAARQTKNPFTLIALADMEMANGDLGQARENLRRAKWWFGDEPAVFEALARLERAQGNDLEAKRAMLRAQELRAEASADD
jgi:Flp pilus assembly protein TadD